MITEERKIVCWERKKETNDIGAKVSIPKFYLKALKLDKDNCSIVYKIIHNSIVLKKYNCDDYIKYIQEDYKEAKVSFVPSYKYDTAYFLIQKSLDKVLSLDRKGYLKSKDKNYKVKIILEDDYNTIKIERA